MAVTRLDSFKLFSAQASNGDSVVIPIPVNGLITAYYTGSFGGGTAQLMGSPDGGLTWLPLASAFSTSGGLQTVQTVSTAIKVTLSGATASSLNVWIVLPDYN